MVSTSDWSHDRHVWSKEIKLSSLGHWVAIAAMISATTPLFAQQETRQRSPEPGDQYYGIIDREIGTFDGDELVRNDVYFTEAYAEERGRISQSQILIDGIPRRYEMEFTEGYTETWGIRRATEDFDANGQRVSIGYTFYDGSEYVFEGDRLGVVQNFEPRLLQPLIDAGEYQASSNPARPLLSFDLRGLAGSTLVTSIPVAALPIAPNERAFVRLWLIQRQGNDISHLYNSKITVNENGSSVVLLLQDPLVGGIVGLESTVVYYYHLGALDNQPINIVVGYFEYGEQ